MPKDIWDNFEEAGHDFTFVGTKPGASLYICENCGSFLITANNKVPLFHSPPNTHASITVCVHVWTPPEKTLKKKMDEYHGLDLEMLASPQGSEDSY